MPVEVPEELNIFFSQCFLYYCLDWFHFIFANDVILHIEYPKDATRKLLELINEFVKLQDTKLTLRNL